jgi:hypothetical protein
MIAQKLATYNYQASPIWIYLRQQFISGIRHRELVSVVTVLCGLFDSLPQLTRSEKRSYPLLVRWFDGNWSAIAPLLPFIHLRDFDDAPIDFERERVDQHF